MAARRSSPAATGDRVCLGVVTGARGLRGELRVKTFTADPADLGAYGPLTDEAGTRRFEARVTGQAKGVVIVRLSGVDDRTAAEALKGERLYVARAMLPPPEDGEFYHHDLIGLRADRADGGTLGTVRAVYDFGAGDVLEIAAADGGTLMVPFTRAVVPEIDLGGRRLVVDPPPGLLDDVKEGDDG